MKSGAFIAVIGVLLLAASATLALRGTDFAGATRVVDSHGQTATEFVHSTYVAMLENRYAQVRDRFNSPYLQYIERDSGSLEAFFEPRVGAWRVDRLAVRPMDSQVRPDMPRVKAFQDDGAGRPGMVNDVMLIDGRWTYVLWSNFQS